MPAEWEPHEATWITWPHSPTDWPGKLAAIQWPYAEIVRKITPGEKVRILVNDARHEARARKVLEGVAVDFGQIEFFCFPTNRGWNRDFGPIFVLNGKRKAAAIARFRFNGWAKYSNWRKDDRIPDRLAANLKIPKRPIIHKGREVILEGGAIDVNGMGTLITTEECLLHPQRQVRNPGFTRQDYEDVFRTHLGIRQVLWLGNGILGDDTHGHVDDICRFVKADTVVMCREPDTTDANHAILEENWKRMGKAVLLSGKKLKRIALPMPDQVWFQKERLPASYANFYISNKAVLVPTFNDPKDREALTILARLFPTREVVGIHAIDLVWGLGTIHCLTQQQPKA